MSEENFEAFKRGNEAIHRQDIEALLEVLDPDVEWHPAIQPLLEGGVAVYRGHGGIRTMFRDFFDAFAELHVEFSEIRDLGDRVVAIGRLRATGHESGADTDSPWGGAADFKNGKIVRIRTYLDPKEALEAAGLEE